ncbi:hypothetical protein Cpa01nite_23500 [Cellulomonas pakistanensis]|uniref:Uncharacterized protein n=1 Tax=Cellulomonas pakistanensis TaxID=992287 RepID=A0A919U6G1_9CELL|nr:hypothetical protein Cpa01nite_23500 [Cellulomonas pakistanensis]
MPPVDREAQQAALALRRDIGHGADDAGAAVGQQLEHLGALPCADQRGLAEERQGPRDVQPGRDVLRRGGGGGDGARGRGRGDRARGGGAGGEQEPEAGGREQAGGRVGRRGHAASSTARADGRRVGAGWRVRPSSSGRSRSAARDLGPAGGAGARASLDGDVLRARTRGSHP